MRRAAFSIVVIALWTLVAAIPLAVGDQREACHSPDHETARLCTPGGLTLRH
jgi:hypothetical protein